MALKTLVQLLQGMTVTQLENQGEELASKQVILPVEWRAAEVALHSAVWRKSRGYNLRLDGHAKKTLADTIPLLLFLLDRTRGLSFDPATFAVKANFYWTADSFAQETGFEGLTRIRINGNFYTINPKKTRVGFVDKFHQLDADLKGNSMQISAKGDYSSLIPRIIDELKPQFITIQLSASDAQRWIKNSSWFERLVLKRLLKPKKQSLLSFSMGGGGVSLSEEDVIQVTMPTAVLAKCVNAIGRPLINHVIGEDSFIVSITKVFPRGREVLSTLKSLVRITSELKTDTVFDHPILTTSQAKKLLEKEIKIVANSYEDSYYLGTHTHTRRGPLVERLARDHFGDDILVPFGDMDPAQYLAFLQGHGFVYSGEAGLKQESPYIQKEMYLFTFFQQSYATDPRDSVERFRQCYIQSQPRITIDGETTFDAAAIGEMKMSSHASLLSFSLEECSGHGENEVSVSRLSPSSDDVHCWVRLSLDSPCKLLSLQEEFCERVGIRWH